MAKPLDERIAAAMAPDARIATVAELITEVSAAIGDVQAEHDRLDGISKSATASETEADAAADAAAKLGRKIIRLTAKREQLETRHGEIVASERQKKKRAEYEAISQRRDALAAELAERWPAITDEIVSLLTRLEVSDTECAAFNRSPGGFDRFVSAEVTARGCAGNFVHGIHQVTRLYNMSLPSLLGQGLQEMAWPRPNGQSRMPVPTP